MTTKIFKTLMWYIVEIKKQTNNKNIQAKTTNQPKPLTIFLATDPNFTKGEFIQCLRVRKFVNATFFKVLCHSCGLRACWVKF